MGISAINPSHYTAYTGNPHTKSVEKETSVATDNAVSVRISSEALERLAAQTHGEASVKDLDEMSIRAALPDRNAVSARKAAPPEQKQIQEIEVTGIYREETLAYFVDAQLSDKLAKSNQIANQMEMMIRGTVYNRDATVEQRAIDREAALKLAQYMADNYFENREEAKSFLDTISRFAENDMLREKGYVVLDNSDIAPFKSCSMPNAPSGYVRIDYEALRDITGGNKIRAEKEDALAALRNDIVRRFEDNEKNADDTVKNIKTLMKETAFDGSFASSLEKLFSAVGPAQAAKWNSIVNLLHT